MHSKRLQHFSALHHYDESLVALCYYSKQRSILLKTEKQLEPLKCISCQNKTKYMTLNLFPFSKILAGRSAGIPFP